MRLVSGAEVTVALWCFEASCAICNWKCVSALTGHHYACQAKDACIIKSLEVAA